MTSASFSSEKNKFKQSWKKFWKRGSIHIGDKEIDYLSGPESLTYFQNKSSNILLFGDSYSLEDGFCDRCTLEQKCIYMEEFLDLWKKYPQSEGDFVHESKKFFTPAESTPLSSSSASSSSMISTSMSTMADSKRESPKIQNHYIDIREIPNIKTLIDYVGLTRIYKKLDDIDRKVTITNAFAFTQDDIKSIWDLCSETQKYFRINEYDADQLTELMKMYVYSDNFTDKLADVVVDQSRDTLKIGTKDVSNVEFGIGNGLSSESNVHDIRLQILNLKDTELQLTVSKWFNESLSKYVKTYITDSSVTPGLVHALSIKSTFMQFGNALSRFKKCIMNMMKLCDLLMDTYAIAKILQLMKNESSKNIIVYAGGYHVEAYRDFLRQYLNMSYITAPKTGPRCLDLTDLDIKLA